MFSAFCYTQFADTFQEVNGLLYPDPENPVAPDFRRGAWQRTALRAGFEKMVERKGIEPSTFALRTRRSPS